MTVPVTGDFDAQESAVKLGELLADLTSGLSAAEIHATIAERIESSEDDPRLASLVADGAVFATMWTALSQGRPLPDHAWETVVLPTLVAFSPQQILKVRLERATSLWLTIRDTGQDAAAEIIEGQARAVSGGDTRRGIAAGHVGSHPVLTLFPTDDLTVPAATQRWPRSLAALAVVALAVAGGFWWLDNGSTTGDQSALQSPLGVSQLEQQQTPGTQTTGGPVALPSPGPVDPAVPSTAPPPSPTWAGPGPAIAPTAPLDLTVRSTTSTTVGLLWSPPTNPGSGLISHYRIFRDGADVGWTAETRAAINRLMPGASYGFSVVAYNQAGLASPSSEVVSATTATDPATPGPTAAPVTVRISPQPAITLGDSFAVVGAGWPCTAPAQVRVLLGGQPVALGQLDAQGAFTAAVAVDSDVPATPHVHHLITGEPIVLTKGPWQVTVELAAQPSCAATISKSAQVTFRTGN